MFKIFKKEEKIVDELEIFESLTTEQLNTIAIINEKKQNSDISTRINHMFDKNNNKKDESALDFYSLFCQ